MPETMNLKYIITYWINS